MIMNKIKLDIRILQDYLQILKQIEKIRFAKNKESKIFNALTTKLQNVGGLSSTLSEVDILLQMAEAE